MIDVISALFRKKVQPHKESKSKMSLSAKDKWDSDLIETSSVVLSPQQYNAITITLQARQCFSGLLWLF